MKLVLDTSMALSWLFARKKVEEIKCADRALLTMTEVETIVPELWHTEVLNALIVGERRKVVTEAQVIDYLTRLSNLPIITDHSMFTNRLTSILALAREHSLSAYDATYLDLALRTNAVLATFDAELAKAMRRAGGTVFT